MLGCFGLSKPKAALKEASALEPNKTTQRIARLRTTSGSLSTSKIWSFAVLNTAFNSVLLFCSFTRSYGPRPLTLHSQTSLSISGLLRHSSQRREHKASLLCSSLSFKFFFRYDVPLEMRSDPWHLACTITRHMRSYKPPEQLWYSLHSFDIKSSIARCILHSTTINHGSFPFDSETSL